MRHFRCFKRQVWEPGTGYPYGYKPLATPSDSCNTLLETNDESDAQAFCRERNRRWRKHSSRVMNRLASETQARVYFESDRYEYEEVRA